MQMSDARTIKWMVAATLAIVVVVFVLAMAGDDATDEREATGTYLRECIERRENLLDPAASARGLAGTYQCADGNQIKRDGEGHWRISEGGS